MVNVNLNKWIISMVPMYETEALFVRKWQVAGLLACEGKYSEPETSRELHEGGSGRKSRL